MFIDLVVRCDHAVSGIRPGGVEHCVGVRADQVVVFISVVQVRQQVLDAIEAGEA
jgi:hypothetical protein